jgi:hypothetical protein
METIRRHSEGAWALNGKILGSLARLRYLLGARTGNCFQTQSERAKGLWAPISVLRQCKYPLKHSYNYHLEGSIENKGVVSQKDARKKVD